MTLLRLLRSSLHTSRATCPPSTSLVRNYTQPSTTLSNSRMDCAPITPSPTPSSKLDGGDHGSSDEGPHRNTAPLGPTMPHAVDKDRDLDIQSDNDNRGMADHANALKNTGDQAKQAGGDGQKVSWDKEFPNKPKGPVIGLQDERGGIAERKSKNEKSAHN